MQSHFSNSADIQRTGPAKKRESFYTKEVHWERVLPSNATVPSQKRRQIYMNVLYAESLGFSFLCAALKVCLVKAMVFPVVVYGCESWTMKKDEHQKIDAFQLWCWRRLLRVPWTARRSNQSILKEISPGCSLEGLMLKLKLQHFGHLMQRADSLENTLTLEGIGGRRRRG